MLLNELHFFEKLFTPEGITEKQFNDQFDRISRAWEDAAFSVVPHHSLLRYFNHQLECLNHYADRVEQALCADSKEASQLQLLKLIDHLLLYYGPYINWDAQAPSAYHRRVIGSLATGIGSVRNSLASAQLQPAFSRCLLNWLAEATECGPYLHYSLRSLRYLEKLTSQLLSFDFSADEAETELMGLLLRNNFNHLAFLAYLQISIRSKVLDLDSLPDQLVFLQTQKADIITAPEIGDASYDPSYPSLKVMLGNWIQEQITLFETAHKKAMETSPVARVEKQALNLSVAHLAYLIRLVLEENILVSQNTKRVFQFFAANYQTKRQSAISTGSLSKEFYSTDQHTAARVRDMLQKMILRINRNFFPVMVAVGTAISSHPGMH